MCESDLMFLDLNTGEKINIERTSLNYSNSSIAFNAALLNTNRQYRVFVNASNPKGSAFSSTNLSKCIGMMMIVLFYTSSYVIKVHMI